MFRSQAVQPFAMAPRVMPDGTIPEASSASGAQPDGAPLFATYCAVCHGATGHGDGPVAFQLAVPPPDLASHAIAAQSDAQLVAAIGAGTTHMPPYDDALSPAEQLAVAHYVRLLQEGTR